MTGMVQPDLPNYKEDIDNVSIPVLFYAWIDFVRCFLLQYYSYLSWSCSYGALIAPEIDLLNWNEWRGLCQRRQFRTVELDKLNYHLSPLDMGLPKCINEDTSLKSMAESARQQDRKQREKAQSEDQQNCQWSGRISRVLLRKKRSAMSTISATQIHALLAPCVNHLG